MQIAYGCQLETVFSRGTADEKINSFILVISIYIRLLCFGVHKKKKNAGVLTNLI
jgi:hypothetical protein